MGLTVRGGFAEPLHVSDALSFHQIQLEARSLRAALLHPAILNFPGTLSSISSSARRTTLKLSRLPLRPFSRPASCLICPPHPLAPPTDKLKTLDGGGEFEDALGVEYELIFSCR